MTDPLTLAREGIEIAEKATPGPWIKGLTDADGEHQIRTERRIIAWVCRRGNAEDARDAALISHAGTHYTTLCRALLAAHECEAAMRDALNEYGEHRGRCAWHAGTYDEPRYCDCGLSAALTQNGEAK